MRARSLLVAALVTVVALSLSLLLTFSYGRDQGIYAAVARVVLEGGMPYRDAWDFKPPGIFLVYAASRALLGSAPWAIRVVEVVGLAGTAALLCALARRWWGDWRIGLLAAAMAALIHAQLDFWHSGQPESFGGMLAVLGTWLGTDRRRKGQAARLLLSGVAFGCAGLLKPPLAGAGAVVAIALGVAARRRGEGLRDLLKPALRILLGGALPFALTLFWFAQRGALDALVEVLFRFTPQYTALAWQGRSFVDLLIEAARRALLDYSALVAAGLALTALAWRRLDRRGWGVLAGIIAVQLVGVALQGKFFPYHYGGMWPFAALLAAPGWWWAGRWAASRPPPARRAALAGLLLAVAGLTALRTATKDVEGHFWWRSIYRAKVFLLRQGGEADRDRLGALAGLDRGANRRLAAELAQRVPAHEPIYIWGFEPVVYVLADRDCASRYIYNAAQRAPWWAEGARLELMEELGRRPPRAIVVQRGDTIPMVTGHGLDSAQQLDDFAALRRLIEQDYGKLMTIGPNQLYLRR